MIDYASQNNFKKKHQLVYLIFTHTDFYSDLRRACDRDVGGQNGPRIDAAEATPKQKTSREFWVYVTQICPPLYLLCSVVDRATRHAVEFHQHPETMPTINCLRVNVWLQWWALFVNVAERGLPEVKSRFGKPPYIALEAASTAKRPRAGAFQNFNLAALLTAEHGALTEVGEWSVYFCLLFSRCI